EDSFTEVASQISPTSRCLPLQRLIIKFAFAGNNNVRAFDFLLQSHGFGHDLKAGLEFRITKADQPESQPAGGACPGFVAEIAAQIAHSYVGQPGQRTLQGFELLGRGTLLRAKGARGTIRTE